MENLKILEHGRRSRKSAKRTVASALFPAAALALLLASAPIDEAVAASDVRYDEHGRPYVILVYNGKPTRVYCEKALYGAFRCPDNKPGMRFGPYDRDFAFSQGYQILP